jgi:tetratricopeptide (TPR) repeat protein
MLATMKAHEGDLVELAEDLPKYGLKRGQRGFVIEAFSEPSEAYDLEFEDDEGEFVGFAYSVKPEQIKSTDEILKEEYEQGMKFLNEGIPSKAIEAFKRAIELKPECIGNLHNSILELHQSAIKGIGEINELKSLIGGLQFVLQVNPNFKLAEYNIAIVYLNYGFQRAIQGDTGGAIGFYRLALGIESPAEVVACLKNNFAAAYTSLSVQEQQSGNLEKSLQYSFNACEVNPSETTRHNLGASYANLGWDYLNKGDFVIAIELLERAQLTGLMAPQLFNNYGVALAALGNLDTAVSAFSKAIELSPEDEIAKNNLKTIEDKMKSANSKELSAKIADIIPIYPIQQFPIQQLYQAVA